MKSPLGQKIKHKSIHDKPEFTTGQKSQKFHFVLPVSLNEKVNRTNLVLSPQEFHLIHAKKLLIFFNITEYWVSKENLKKIGQEK